MTEDNKISVFARSAVVGRILHDRLGAFACSGDGTLLRLRGMLPAGRYTMSLVTAPGSFDPETTMLTLKSWPSMADVKAGPFDFDHTQYRMAVPTFRVTVNGYDWGLAWCEVPSPDDIREKRIRAEWGFETEKDGPAEIVLQIPENERNRLSWNDIQQMDIGKDSRADLPLDAIPAETSHPRVLCDSSLFARLAEPRDSTGRALLEGLRAQVESGPETSSYSFSIMAAALLGRLTGEKRWSDEAIAKTIELCGRENWGYHDEPEIMGWNNDRDTGNRMLETAVVFDWLHDELSDRQKQIIAAKLARHCEIAYKITILQRNYWYHRTIEAHGQGLWTGLAAASAALLGHHPRARRWLAWARGNFDEAANSLSEDGIGIWIIFNTIWHFISLAIFERLSGRRHEPTPPFFDSFPKRILEFVSDPFATRVAGVLLLYMAGRNRDPEAQANALSCLGGRNSQSIRLAQFNPFGLLFYDSDVPAGRTTPRPMKSVSAVGLVRCNGMDGLQFWFQCGTPLTPRVHESLNFINRGWWDIPFCGSFAWRVPGKDENIRMTVGLIPSDVPGYRRCTEHSNLITVDGAGSIREGRYLGATFPLSKVAFIEHIATDGNITFCSANLAPAYAPSAGARTIERRWCFFHSINLVIMHDRIVLDRPRRLVWHIHGNRGQWKRLAESSWSIAEGHYELTVKALSSIADGMPASPGKGLVSDTVVQERVPVYGSGLNRYKNSKWQPELYRENIDIPPMPALRFQPESPAKSWELTTVMQIGRDDAGKCLPISEQGMPGVALPDGSRVLWTLGRSFRIFPEIAVSADAIFAGSCGPATKTLAFQTSAQEPDCAGKYTGGPLDLRWDSPKTDPVPWKSGDLS